MDHENQTSKAQPSALHKFDRVGPYAIERLLGSGGMADVYFGMHETLQRPAAIKVLRAALATDELHLQRFMQEARAVASLVHPNIVQVYDVGQDGSIRYIAQEYVPGINLRQYLHDRGAMPVRDALSVLLQVLAALKKSSSAGIVHRDIKPENILLTQEGEVKVTDFGLARLLYQDDPQLTRAGTTLGTPMYMSPEQLQEGTVDVRSDLYSLGVTLFQMLAGRPPFTGETPLALAMQQVQAAPPNLRELRSDIPESLCALVDRLLRKKPGERYESPDEVLQSLRESRAGDLRNCWPEQTIAFPEASTRGAHAGPSQATLALQARLNQRKKAVWKRTFKWGAVAALVLASIGGGVTLAYVRPVPDVFQTSKEMYYGVTGQKTAEEQYTYPLLSADNSNEYLWRAVPHFFPPEESSVNRTYAGKAKLQLARRQAVSKPGEALANLREIRGDPDLPVVLKAIACLEEAAIETRNGNLSAVDPLINEAKSMNLTQPQWETLNRNIPEEMEDFWSRDR